MTRVSTSAQQGEAQPFVSNAGDSPVDAAVPFWVTACVRLLPPCRRNGTKISPSLANAVILAVQALIADRLRTEGEADAPLDRERIARRCGLGDATKVSWLFDYLERIGFLRVRREYASPGRGRQPDTFTVFTQPPLNYVGPRTHAELERALDDPQRPLAGILFVDKTAGQDEHAQSGAFSNDQRAESRVLLSETAGQDEHAQSGAFISDQIDLLSPRGERGDRSIEPVPGVAAKPPATGHDERVLAEVRRLVRRLPWTEWARRQKVSYTLNERDTRLLVEPICAAIGASRLTIEQAERIGPAALAEVTRSAKPAAYVADAFGNHLDVWLERITVVPPEDDPLPLPDLQSPGKAATGATGALNTPGEGVGTGEASGVRERRSQGVLRAVEPEEPPASPEEIAAILRPASNQG